MKLPGTMRPSLRLRPVHVAILSFLIVAGRWPTQSVRGEKIHNPRSGSGDGGSEEHCREARCEE